MEYRLHAPQNRQRVMCKRCGYVWCCYFPDEQCVVCRNMTDDEANERYVKSFEPLSTKELIEFLKTIPSEVN